MAKRIGGMRRKTRGKMSRPKALKGRISIRQYLQPLEKGDKVRLDADSSIHKGMYFPRFHGKVGIVQSKKGTCYEVQINDFTKKKMLVIHPIHLKKM